ncbi:MAG: thioredoxin family protein [Rhodocyclales bacterium]|nr:thioredoxin family protein [Rhodocyclales bacterium]
MNVPITARRRFLHAFAAFVAAVFLLPAQASPAQPFDDAAFRKAQQEGRTILVEVHADWCSACAKQKPILESLGKEAAFDKVVRFKVDFDKPGTALKALRVTSQATLVLFKGEKEVARSTFDTDTASIRGMLAKAS